MQQPQGDEYAWKKQKVDGGSSEGGAAANCHLYRLPTAVLLAAAHDYLLMRDVRSLVCSAQWLHPPLRYYRINDELSLSAALALVNEPAGPAAAHDNANANGQRRWRFGIPTRVAIESEAEWSTWQQHVGRFHSVRHLVLRICSYDGENDEDEAIALPPGALPPQLHTLQFSNYTRFWQLDKAQWPATLTQLLGLHGAKWPADWQQLPDGLRTLTFTDEFNKPLDGLRLPDSITELRFGPFFNQSLSSVHLPSSLRTLHLDAAFNQPLPAQLATLTNLTQLDIRSWHFVQPLGDVAFPPSLRSFTLHTSKREYPHPFHLRQLPPSCTQVELDWTEMGDAVGWSRLQLPDTVCKLKMRMLGAQREYSFADLRLPAELDDLFLAIFTDVSLVTVRWPAQLRSLTLRMVRSIISDECLPPSLTSLTLVVRSEQEQLQLAGLTQLTTLHLGRYKGTIELPPSLTELELADEWNRPMSELHLPPSLKILQFGDKFNQPLAGVALPPSLTHLSFGEGFNQPLADVPLPPSLRTLSLGRSFAQPLSDVALPAGLQRLELLNPNCPPAQLPRRWPAALCVLTVDKKSQLAAVQSAVPNHVTVTVQ